MTTGRINQVTIERCVVVIMISHPIICPHARRNLHPVGLGDRLVRWIWRSTVCLITWDIHSQATESCKERLISMYDPFKGRRLIMSFLATMPIWHSVHPYVTTQKLDQNADHVNITSLVEVM